MRLAKRKRGEKLKRRGETRKERERKWKKGKRRREEGIGIMQGRRVVWGRERERERKVDMGCIDHKCFQECMKYNWLNTFQTETVSCFRFSSCLPVRTHTAIPFCTRYLIYHNSVIVKTLVRMRIKEEMYCSTCASNRMSYMKWSRSHANSALSLVCNICNRTQYDMRWHDTTW